MIIRQIFNPPNWFTSASLFCGLYAIILAGQANGDPDYFYKAGLMVFFAGLFDALDGRVARMTGTGSQFGVQLDSLVDLISFGVAPACIVFFWGLQPFGTAGVLVSGLLMLAGAFRLARFNVLADGKAHKYSMGLTITLGGGTVAAVVMCFAGNAMGPPENAAWIVAFVVCVALLEISDVPFRTMKTFRLSPPTLALLVVVGGVCLTIGAVYDISAVLMSLGLLHVVSGPIEALVTFPRKRRLRRAERAAARDPRTRPPQEPEDES